MTQAIDKVEAKIIRLLQKDGRMPTVKIAKTIGISEGTVRNRLKRLLADEVIQIVAVGNPFKLGFGISGYSKMAVDIKKIQTVIDQLMKLPEVWYIALATGGTDLDIEFHLRSLEDLRTLVYERLNQIDGIIRTDTTLTIHFIKRCYQWGTALDQEDAD